MTSLTTLPVAIYTRISQDRAGLGVGVSGQEQDCLAYARDRRLDVLETITENDVSASGRVARKGFKRLIGLAKDGSIGGVIVWHPDRLYRVIEDLEELIRVCEVWSPSFKIHAVRFSDIDLGSPSGRQVVRILTSVSQHEIEHKAERQSRAHQRIFDEGRWSGGTPPTGYVRGDASGTLVVDEPVAAAIKTVVRGLLDGEIESLNEATRRFRELTGRTNIKPVTLKKVLLGPSIIGMRHYIPVAARRAAVKSKRPAPKGMYSPASWPAIIDDLTQERLRQKLASQIRRGKPRRSLLGGLLKCGRCGAGMGFSNGGYRCNFSSGGCASVGVSSKGLEAHVRHQMSVMMQHPTYNLEPVLDPVESDDLQIELLTLAARRDHLISLYTRGLMEEENLDKAVGEIRVQEDEARRRAETVAKAAVLQRESAQNEAGAWTEALENDNVSQQRAAIGSMWKEIIIYPSPNGKRSGAVFDSSRVVLRGRPGHAAQIRESWLKERDVTRQEKARE